jgi:hypothetical protein
LADSAGVGGFAVDGWWGWFVGECGGDGSVAPDHHPGQDGPGGDLERSVSVDRLRTFVIPAEVIADNAVAVMLTLNLDGRG